MRRHCCPLKKLLSRKDILMPEEGTLEVNKQYQEMMKVVINLVTASLVLPVALLKNILQVDRVRDHLFPLAYLSWSLLGISLIFCLGFYFCSMKFAKAVYQ